MAPGMIRQRSLCHPTMAGLRRQPDADGAFTLAEVRGCAPGPALLKGRRTHEGHLVTQTILVDSASQAPRSGDHNGQAPRSGDHDSQASRSADSAGQMLGGAGERALDCLLAAGFERTEPPILHPAAIFLDMSGEEVRRRLFLTADAAGEELCLRPEYTIPVCRAYLNSDKAGKIAEYSYLGPVFRARAGQAGEQTQTGLGSFGRRDAEAADAEGFSLAMEAAIAAGGGALVARIGDAGLFDAVLDSLKIPEPWRRRLRRGVARGRSLEAIFNRPSESALAQPGVLAALESADHAGAKALVEDLLAIAGIDAVGGRSAGEIADRFLEQASLRSGQPIEAEKRGVLDAFLAISGDPDQAG